MNQRAAVIIIKDGKMLLMYRERNGKKYFAVPGGMIEDGETPEQAAIREVKEETNLDVILGAKLFDFEREIYEHNGIKHYHGNPNGKVHEYFFLAESFSGEVALGGEELGHNSEDNYYELVWIDIGKLDRINMLPPEAKKRIIDELRKNKQPC